MVAETYHIKSHFLSQKLTEGEGDGIIRLSDTNSTGQQQAVANPAPVTLNQETASTIPTSTDQPSTESPVGRDAGVHSSGADLDTSASNNQLDSQTLAQREPTVQNATNKTASILPMIVRTDDGYIYWMPISSSAGLTNSVVVLFACLLIRLLQQQLLF